jgi:hypothetical protein
MEGCGIDHLLLDKTSEGPCFSYNFLHKISLEKIVGYKISMYFAYYHFQNKYCHWFANFPLALFYHSPAEMNCGSSDFCVSTYYPGGEDRRFRVPHGGPPVFHKRPDGLWTGRPQLTAGQGRPVCQPWFPSDKAAEQRPEASIFVGSLLSALPTKVC